MYGIEKMKGISILAQNFFVLGFTCMTEQNFKIEDRMLLNHISQKHLCRLHLFLT
jgi:hypothetical protein